MEDKKPNLELQGISETCKILGLDSYDPVRFIEIIRSAYENAFDIERSISKYREHCTDDKLQGPMYLWKLSSQQIVDDLGRILLQFDKQTADETIEEEIYARDNSRD